VRNGIGSMVISLFFLFRHVRGICLFVGGSLFFFVFNVSFYSLVSVPDGITAANATTCALVRWSDYRPFLPTIRLGRV